MGLNDGFLETFIFNIETATFKVVLNFTKGICTVYDNNGITRNGRILIRIEKLHNWQMSKLKKQINDYIEGRCSQLPNFNSYRKRPFTRYKA